VVMSGFVEHIMNSPQMRCQSAKQVGGPLDVRRTSEDIVADRRPVGKLF